MKARHTRVAALLLGAAACTPSDRGGQGVESSPATQPSPSTQPSHVPQWFSIKVQVRLDEGPAAFAVIKQGGVSREFSCNQLGEATVEVDLALPGEIVLHASHYDSRIGYAHIDPAQPPAQLTMQLHRFDRSDNPDYPFWDPGDPELLLNCAHCHHKMNAIWYGSPHRRAASNPTVQDMYAGAVSAIKTQAACEASGGHWWLGRRPGTEMTTSRCYLGAGALPDLNDHCGVHGSCDEVAVDVGGCADCHAPGINGKIGGRNLLEATGPAYEDGVHCDVCHKVESIQPGAAPGVAGYLKILRPSEPPSIPGEPFEPLVFGPYRDVSQIQMGAVYRKHFKQSEFCAGCHDYGVKVRPRWGPLHPQKWPSGELPVQSTFNEWQQGPYAPEKTCMECHMPADLQAQNAAGLEEAIASGPSQIAGWIRPPGSVRKHSWIGPRTPESGLLQRAAHLEIHAQIHGQALSVDVKITNVGAGHALPTGLPSRSMLLVTQAYCDEQELAPLGGDVIPSFGGYIQKRTHAQGFEHWPGAQPGQKIRVARYTGNTLHEDPILRFGPTKMPAMPLAGVAQLDYVGTSTVLAVGPDGRVQLDRPLPPGDVAFLGDAYAPGAADPLRLAGTPGFAFARVLVDKQGQENVPSFRANDIASDNRILPQGSFTTRHRFALSCTTPKVTATLLYRSFPPSWVRERRWDRPDAVMSMKSLRMLEGTGSSTSR